VPGAVVGWLAAGPDGFGHRAHLLLGGLCAQAPGHTFVLGGQSLPFDARMTGIYLGALIGLVALAVSGRTRAARPPGFVTWGVLAAMVGALGIDGTNSLLVDLGLWHPYAPSNGLRVTTGAMAGVALAVTIGYLLAETVWARGAMAPFRLVSTREVAGLTAVALPLAALVPLAPGWAFVPICALLIAGSTVTVGGLVLVSGLIATGREGTFGSARQLRPWWGSVATGAMTAIVALAVIRVVAETLLGPANYQ